MKKIVIISGLISGLIISSFMATAMMLVGCSSGTGSEAGSMALGFAAMLLGFSLIYVAIKIFRDKQNGGVISFGKAFQIGLIISVIASSMYVATWAIEYKYFLPDFMDKYAAHMIDKIKSSGATQAYIDSEIADIASRKEKYKNPFYFTFITFSEIFPVGLIVSLISALILKRKKTQQPAIS